MKHRTYSLLKVNSKWFNGYWYPNKEKLQDGERRDTGKCLLDVEEMEARRSQRVRKEKDLDTDFISSQGEKRSRDSVIKKIPIMLIVERIPNLWWSMASRDIAFWKETINDEMDSMLSNNALVLVDLPQGSKAISWKWVFK